MGDPSYHPKIMMYSIFENILSFPPPTHPKKHVHVDLPPCSDSPGALWRRSQGREGMRSDHPREERGKRKVSIRLHLI